jgi:hypothetical protein
MPSIETTVLLSSAYLAPIQYYYKLISYENVIIEQFEHYSKQSYRNRCNILSANGVLPLTIPVIHSNGVKTYTKDIKIDNSARWKAMHKRAIESAYRSSPFYIYYADEFYEVFDNEYKFLLDFNNKLQSLILNLLNIRINISYSDNFIIPKNNEVDLRESIHPKARVNKPDGSFIPLPYYQVFQQKFGFVPNLSIIDLLFNDGPSAKDVLLKCSI